MNTIHRTQTTLESNITPHRRLLAPLLAGVLAVTACGGESSGYKVPKGTTVEIQAIEGAESGSKSKPAVVETYKPAKTKTNPNPKSTTRTLKPAVPAKAPEPPEVEAEVCPKGTAFTPGEQRSIGCAAIDFTQKGYIEVFGGLPEVGDMPQLPKDMYGRVDEPVRAS